MNNLKTAWQPALHTYIDISIKKQAACNKYELTFWYRGKVPATPTNKTCTWCRARACHFVWSSEITHGLPICLWEHWKLVIFRLWLFYLFTSVLFHAKYAKKALIHGITWNGNDCDIMITKTKMASALWHLKSMVWM